jgi:hypothetical protein
LVNILKATPIEQRREAQDNRPKYEKKERAKETTERLLGACEQSRADASTHKVNRALARW